MPSSILQYTGISRLQKSDCTLKECENNTIRYLVCTEHGCVYATTHYWIALAAVTGADFMSSSD